MDDKFYNFRIFVNENENIDLLFKKCHKHKIGDTILNLVPQLNYGRIIMSGFSIDDPTEQMYYMVCWEKNKIDGPFNQKQIAEFKLNKLKYHSESFKINRYLNLKNEKLN